MRTTTDWLTDLDFLLCSTSASPVEHRGKITLSRTSGRYRVDCKARPAPNETANRPKKTERRSEIMDTAQGGGGAWRLAAYVTSTLFVRYHGIEVPVHHHHRRHLGIVSLGISFLVCHSLLLPCHFHGTLATYPERHYCYRAQNSEGPCASRSFFPSLPVAPHSRTALF